MPQQHAELSASFDSKQMALFSVDEASDPRELPLIIASKFHFPLQHYEQENGNWYAVQDWITGVAQTDNPRRFWTDLKKRAKKAGVELYASCVQLPYTAADGKTYKVDFADSETLYLISQRMSAETGIRNLVLAYLAKAGVAVDKQRRRQLQADPLWLRARNDGKDDRKRLTDAIANHAVRLSPFHYSAATNAVYEGLYEGRNAKALRDQLNLTDKDNLRDYQPRQAQLLQSLAEQTAADLINRFGKTSPDEVIGAVRQTAELFGVQARQLSDLLGIDIATGRPLIDA